MRLGIIQPLTGIGDMIVHVSHIRQLVAHYQPKHTILYTKKATHAHQYAHLMGIDEVNYLGVDSRPLRPDLHAQPKRSKKTHFFRFIYQLCQSLKSARLDQIVILHPSPKYAIAAYLAKIPKRYGYGYQSQKYFLTQNFGLSKYHIQRAYHTRKCDAFLKQMGIIQEPLLPQLTPLPQQSTCPPIASAPIIAVGIGTSGVDRQWGADHFSTLVRWLLDQTHNHVLLCGGKQDANHILKVIMQQLDGNQRLRVHHTCDLSLIECIQHMQTSLCYVGNDTGFLHIAVALKKPTLGLFGSPYQAVLDYSPLITTCIPELTQAAKQSVPPNDHILHISPKQVIHKLQSMLNTLDQTTHAITATA